MPEARPAGSEKVIVREVPGALTTRRRAALGRGLRSLAQRDGARDLEVDRAHGLHAVDAQAQAGAVRRRVVEAREARRAAQRLQRHRDGLDLLALGLEQELQAVRAQAAERGGLQERRAQRARALRAQRAPVEGERHADLGEARGLDRDGRRVSGRDDAVGLDAQAQVAGRRGADPAERAAGGELLALRRRDEASGQRAQVVLGDGQRGRARARAAARAQVREAWASRAAAPARPAAWASR